MDRDKTTVVSDRIFKELNSGMTCLNLYLGIRLGLFQALADIGPATPSQLTKHTEYSERCIREWMECMAAGTYVEYDPPSDRFFLSPEVKAVLLEDDHPRFSAGVISYLPSFASALPLLIQSFKTGKGVPYAAFGADCRDAIGRGNRPMFVNDYVSKWIPSMPDIEAKLRKGGRVADIGCGQGWSSIVLAQGFPAIHIDAVDPDENSIREARRNAELAGVSDRITFHQEYIEECVLQGPYVMVAAFECLHFMAYPIPALQRMRELASPYGAVFIGDEAVGDTLEENQTFLGHFMYNFSVLLCLPQAMALPDSAQTGAVLAPSKVRSLAKQSGFKKVDILPIENELWRFYRFRP